LLRKQRKTLGGYFILPHLVEPMGLYAKVRLHGGQAFALLQDLLASRLSKLHACLSCSCELLINNCSVNRR